MRRTRALLLSVAMVGCGGGKQAGPSAPSPELAAPATGDNEPKAKAPSPGLPDGYVTMFALGMMRTDMNSGTVILSDEKRTVFVPIVIGGTESTSIAHRLEGEPFVRPLTHDLIDSILKEVDAELVQVQVDALRGNTFIGSILIRDGDRIFRLDARPSDAIALATGNAIPIYVAKAVVTYTGIPTDDPRADAYKAALASGELDSSDLAEKVDALADKTCACTDMACMQAVQIELMTLARNAPAPAQADQQEIMKSMQRMSDCIGKMSQPTP